METQENDLIRKRQHDWRNKKYRKDFSLQFSTSIMNYYLIGLEVLLGSSSRQAS